MYVYVYRIVEQKTTKTTTALLKKYFGACLLQFYNNL